MAIPQRTDSDSAEGRGDTVEREKLDPRRTDHPTGAQQAAENEANDPPG